MSSLEKDWYGIVAGQNRCYHFLKRGKIVEIYECNYRYWIWIFSTSPQSVGVLHPFWWLVALGNRGMKDGPLQGMIISQDVRDKGDKMSRK